MIIFSSVILYNSYHNIIDNDDSILSRYHYRSNWILIIISGIFFTLGSMAFLRAVHETPPMKPLFSYWKLKCVQSDELLGMFYLCFSFETYFLFILQLICHSNIEFERLNGINYSYVVLY